MGLVVVVCFVWEVVHEITATEASHLVLACEHDGMEEVCGEKVRRRSDTRREFAVRRCEQQSFTGRATSRRQ